MENSRINIVGSHRPVGPKRAAAKASAKGNVAGIIYGAGKAGIPVEVVRKDLEIALRTPFGRNNVFTITLDGQGHQVMVKSTEFNPVRREITHVDFYEVDSDQKVVLDVPVEVVGKSAGEKLGGLLQVTSRTVRLVCKVRDIPTTVKHDVTPLGLDTTVSVNEMTPPEGCTLVFKHRFPVIRVWAKRGSKTEEAAKA